MLDDETKKRRIAELELSVRRHQDLYYNGQAAISDADFDALWDELKALDPGNAVFVAVGADNSGYFAKVKHILPMGSQEKAANPEEFLAWAQKAKPPLFVVQDKLDGASLELQYKDGRFLRALTRGDGLIGDDISANARKMQGVPLTLPEAFSGAVRGEVVMSKAVHAAYFADKANCRNAANGLMKRKDGKGVEHLQVICYDAAPEGLYDPEAGGLFGFELIAPFDDERSKIDWLKGMGFTVARTQSFGEAYEVIDYRARVVVSRSELPYDIDGLVVKNPSVDPDDMRRARPEKQIAFKFPLEEAVSTLLDVEWSETGSTFTPIGIMEPVRLAGTTVKRANLANTNTIKGMGLKLGARVIVVKRGEIIPKIEGLVDCPPDARDIVAPTACSCGAALVDEGTRLYCPNSACPKKALHRLEKWLSVLDIRDFGVGILAKLFESGRVRRIAELYTLTTDELAGYERMGAVSAAKILQNLHARRELSLPQFIAGFDIENIGLLIAQKALGAGFDSLEALRKASVEELAHIEGFGEITARALSEGLAALGQDMDEAIQGGKLSFTQGGAVAGPLSGLSFCFTGELLTMKRSKAEALTLSLGGAVRSSVTKNLSYLVTNDAGSGSSKNKKALAMQVPIIDEKSFLFMTEGQANNG
ncbi:MAG TPA: DNA ligase (NAD(+)) LigA [Spirochaetaceae bacterium]|jgi:DNA ligase (NAD+)|nr:DNA ligase (NAD(+)) LigA [Spirochaetaceae bacterium]